jgi:hypothetical protein
MLFSHTTGHYRLMLLFIPLFGFFECKTQTRIDPLYSLCFALLLVPKNYFHIKNHSWVPAVIFETIVMAAMFGVIIAEGMKARFLKEEDAEKK